jgi:CRISPR-associated endonuclease/helicase Cas3
MIAQGNLLGEEDFPEFFVRLHGKDTEPYAWQRRLLHHLVTTGRWPERITAPTGAGKTAVVAVHTFAVAMMAAGTAVRVPRRLCLVVNRRVLVDDQHQYARELADLLEAAQDTDDDVVARVARLLRGLRSGGLTESPLLVTRLRGGVPASRAWRDEPVACQVMCATPDMWGSRLLFSGYGSAPNARPREAGLLAFDAAAIVDEAHLAHQLLHTARRVAELAQIADLPIPAPVLQVVETTATPGNGPGIEFGVREQDLEHDVALGQRLRAPKPLELLELAKWPLPRTGTGRKAALRLLADRAQDLLTEYGSTVGCFLNTVQTAADLAAELSRRSHLVQIVCGQMRGLDLERISAAHPGLLSTHGAPEVEFLVTTQSLEAGADLDLSAGLTELATGNALAQRAGRVNRRGLRTATRVVVAIPAAELDAKAGVAPYEVDDLNASLGWLRRRAGDPLGLAPWALRTSAAPIPAHQPRRLLYQRPELADAWLWARTSDDLFARPDLDLWLSDDLTPDTEAGLVIRHGLPGDPADAIRLLRDLPPQDFEVLPARPAVLHQALEQRFGADTFGDQSADPLPPPVLIRYEQVLPYDGTVRPGDVVVVDDRVTIFDRVNQIPLLNHGGADTADDVLEVTLPAPIGNAASGRLVTRLGAGSVVEDSAAHDAAVEAMAAAAAVWEQNRGSRKARHHLADILAHLASKPGAEHVAGRLSQVAGLLRGRAKDSDVIIHRDDQDRPIRLLVLDRRKTVLDEEIRQQWTPAAGPVPLNQHQVAVADRARTLAERLSLDTMAPLLHRAGLHHDDGKRDRRFQTALYADASAQPLAKSGKTSLQEIRKRFAESGLPLGWRHEQLSVLYNWNELTDLADDGRALVTRLIGTSHGRGRTAFPHTTADLLPDPTGTIAALSQRLFDEGMWDHLIDRTHTVFGTWGCAYLEGILRAADGQISGEGS